MLGEISHLQLLRRRHLPGHGCKAAGDELHQGRFAVPVGTDQGDAVVVIDANREPPEHRASRFIADANVVESDDRWRQGLRGPRNLDRA